MASGSGAGALHRHRLVNQLALELGLGDFVRHFDQHRAGFAGAHRLIGAPHQVGQFLHVVRQRRPFGHRPIDGGGAEGRAHILLGQRHAAGHDQQRHVLGVGLGDARERVLDAGPGLGGEHAVLLAALDARIAVGDADADALLPAQDRADVDRRARLDHLIARITGEKFGAFALENFGNDFGAIHVRSSLTCLIVRSVKSLSHYSEVGA